MNSRCNYCVNSEYTKLAESLSNYELTMFTFTAARAPSSFEKRHAGLRSRSAEDRCFEQVPRPGSGAGPDEAHLLLGAGCMQIAPFTNLDAKS